MPRSARARWALAAATLALALSPSCYDDADLEGEARELGELTAGDATFRVTATLDGRYRRERRGGGRATYSCATSEEIWTTEISFVETSEEIDVREMGPMRSVGEDRDDAAEILEALELEHCSGSDEGKVVFRIAGLEGHAWRVLHAGEGRAVTGPFESDASDCAAAAAAAPTPIELLTSVWHDAVAAGAELDAQRETRPSSGASSEMTVRLRNGEAACNELLAFGATRESIRCVLALRVRPRDRNGAAVAEAIREGTRDAESEIFSLATPEALASDDDPQVSAALVANGGSTIRKYLKLAPTMERRLEYFAEHVDRCSAEDLPCPGWLMAALGDIANAAGDDEKCDQVRAVALSMIEDEDASPSEALTLVLAVGPTCGSEEAMRSIAMAGLSRPSLATDDPGIARCRVRELRGESGLRDTNCRSLPRYAGEWLKRHCDEDAVARALAILEEAPDGEATVADGPTDGAARILASCDREALDRYLRERNAEGLRLATAEY